MEREDKQQPLTDGALMEYIVHGEFAYKESDVNGTFGAWVGAAAQDGQGAGQGGGGAEAGGAGQRDQADSDANYRRRKR